MVVLSFLVVSQSGAAWAANPDGSTALSSSRSPSVAVSADNDDDCDKDERRNGTAKDDDCDDDDDNGTVKPPKKRIKACEVGNYSVGGSVTLQVKKIKKGGECVRATTQATYPGLKPPAPDGTKFLSPVLDLKVPKKDTVVKFCFAATPGKQPQIYVQSKGEWKPAGGSINNGKICMEVSKSGTFVVIGKK
jgi:hypothetical protein